MPAPKAVWDEINASLDKDIAAWTKGLDEHIVQYEKEQEEKKVKKVGTGVMVAWMLPQELARTLALPGGEKPEDMHVTVAYLGKELTVEQVETVARVLEDLSTKQAPLKGDIAGTAVFPADESTENRQVLVRLVDVPYLESFREKLIASLTGLGIPVVRNHGFCSHITLRYAEEVDASEADSETYPVKVAGVTLCVGEDWTYYPLTGKVVKSWVDF
jgi:2'-5' RNA ligase